MATDKENGRAVAQTVQDLNDIHALKNSAPFNRYFARRLAEIADAAALPWGDRSVTPEELKRAQLVCLKVREIQALLQNDEIANRNIAGVTGHDPTLPKEEA